MVYVGVVKVRVKPNDARVSPYLTDPSTLRSPGKRSARAVPIAKAALVRSPANPQRPAS
jgi:hypothetical protein